MAKKVTIVPLHMLHWDLPLPFRLSDDLSIRNVEGWLKPSTFALWGNYVAPNKIDDLSNVRVAIVHQFSSEGHVGQEEAASRRLAHFAFVALRIIQPTRTRFSDFQCRILADGSLDLFSFRSPSETPIQCPESETLNTITLKHLLILQEFLPAFLSVSDTPKSPLTRAVSYYETGYAGIHDAILQFVTWMMGLEAAFANISPNKNGQRALIAKIENLLPPDLEIYSESPLGDHFTLPKLTVNAVLRDMFDLRNELVHGLWVDDWESTITRPSMQGPPAKYPQILVEAAPYILRKSLQKLIFQEFQAKR